MSSNRYRSPDLCSSRPRTPEWHPQRSNASVACGPEDPSCITGTGPMCENCQSRLAELKRQATRLMHSSGASNFSELELGQIVKEKIALPELLKRRWTDHSCDVCWANLAYLKHEAVNAAACRQSQPHRAIHHVGKGLFVSHAAEHSGMDNDVLAAKMALLIKYRQSMRTASPVGSSRVSPVGKSSPVRMSQRALRSPSAAAAVNRQSPLGGKGTPIRRFQSPINRPKEYPFVTNFYRILCQDPPNPPEGLSYLYNRRDRVGKIKMMLRICPGGGGGLTVDQRRRQLTIVEHKEQQPRAWMYGFDHIFPEGATQSEVCSNTLTDMVQCVVGGSDACLFTYGHPKIGKSYSMVGRDTSPGELGLIPCAISWMFKLISEHKQRTGARFSVRVSAVEIHSKTQTLRDLLTEQATNGSTCSNGPSPSVYLQRDPLSGSLMWNLSELRAPSAEKASFYLDAALSSSNCHTDPLLGDLSDDSRHSHLVFTLHVYQYRVERSGKGGVVGGRSKLHLVDLATSERLGKLREGLSQYSNNLAFSTLGNVMLSVINGARHIPFKDSKLTEFLKESIGSLSCRTSFIGHISSNNMSETMAVAQLASKIHRVRRKKMKYSSTSSGESSCEEGRMRRYYQANVRSNATGDRYSSDPDYTSSSEQSCDTVIYMGPGGQWLSDQELTDGEGPPKDPETPARDGPSDMGGPLFTPTPTKVAVRRALKRVSQDEDELKKAERNEMSAGEEKVASEDALRDVVHMSGDKLVVTSLPINFKKDTLEKCRSKTAAEALANACMERTGEPNGSCVSFNYQAEEPSLPAESALEGGSHDWAFVKRSKITRLPTLASIIVPPPVLPPFDNSPLDPSTGVPDSTGVLVADQRSDTVSINTLLSQFSSGQHSSENSVPTNEEAVEEEEAADEEDGTGDEAAGDSLDDVIDGYYSEPSATVYQKLQPTCVNISLDDPVGVTLDRPEHLAVEIDSEVPLEEEEDREVSKTTRQVYRSLNLPESSVTAPATPTNPARDLYYMKQARDAGWMSDHEVGGGRKGSSRSLLTNLQSKQALLARPAANDVWQKRTPLHFSLARTMLPSGRSLTPSCVASYERRSMTPNQWSRPAPKFHNSAILLNRYQQQQQLVAARSRSSSVVSPAESTASIVLPYHNSNFHPMRLGGSASSVPAVLGSPMREFSPGLPHFANLSPSQSPVSTQGGQTRASPNGLTCVPECPEATSDPLRGSLASCCTMTLNSRPGCPDNLLTLQSAHSGTSTQTDPAKSDGLNGYASPNSRLDVSSKMASVRKIKSSKIPMKNASPSNSPLHTPNNTLRGFQVPNNSSANSPLANRRGAPLLSPHSKSGLSRFRLFKTDKHRSKSLTAAEPVAGKSGLGKHSRTFNSPIQSSSGHGSDNSSIYSGEMAQTRSPVAGESSSGYESNLRESEACLSTSESAYGERPRVLKKKTTRKPSKELWVDLCPSVVKEVELKLQDTSTPKKKVDDPQGLAYLHTQLRKMERHQYKLSQLQAKHEGLKEELAASIDRLLLDPEQGELTSEQMDEDAPDYVAQLEKETELLQSKVNCFKSHILMVTCFDSCTDD